MKNYVAVQDYRLAIETLNHILEKDPANREALRKKRDLFLKQGNWSEAYEAQKSVVKHSKEKDQAAAEKKILLGMEYKLGQELAQNGNFKEAEKALREIVKEDRDFVPGPGGSTETFSSGRGNPDEASQIWLRAYETSANPVFLERLESLYPVHGQSEENSPALSRFPEKAPGGHRPAFFLQPAAGPPGDDR